MKRKNYQQRRRRRRISNNNVVFKTVRLQIIVLITIALTTSIVRIPSSALFCDAHFFGWSNLLSQGKGWIQQPASTTTTTTTTNTSNNSTTTAASSVADRNTSISNKERIETHSSLEREEEQPSPDNGSNEGVVPEIPQQNQTLDVIERVSISKVLKEVDDDVSEPTDATDRPSHNTEQQQSDVTAAVVGVKEHHSNTNNNGKKGNAVGDPDGNDSDDDDDDDDSDELTDWEDIFDDIIENELALATTTPSSERDHDDDDVVMTSSSSSNDLDLLESTTAQLQLEVEYINDEEEEDDEDEVTTIIPKGKTTTATTSSGGIGIRFGQRGNSNSSQKKPLRRGGGDSGRRTDAKITTNTKQSQLVEEEYDQQDENIELKDNEEEEDEEELPTSLQEAYVRAWKSFVFTPPNLSAQQYLQNNARSIDASSKMRLDRRTLYGCLLLEWNGVSIKSSSSSSSSNNNNKSKSSSTTPTSRTTSTMNRKFLDSSTSQSLQAALSLATQPLWRKSFPRTSGIRLYNTNNNNNNNNNLADNSIISIQQANQPPMSNSNDVFSTQQQQQQQQPFSAPPSTSGMSGGFGSATANTRGCPTLSMQETIAMSLAHSLGAGFVVLDDKTISKVRMELLKSGYVNAEDNDIIKPVNLIKTLLTLAYDGTLTTSKSSSSSTSTQTKSRKTTQNNKNKSSNNNKRKRRNITKRRPSIAKAMADDMNSGLDDPFDERALSSFHEMTEWEDQWYSKNNNDIKAGGSGVSDDEQQLSSILSSSNNDDKEDGPAKLPLVIFVRTHASNSLLKSKSVVEFLLNECESPEGINLLVLGQGIDATTESLPAETVATDSSSNNFNDMMMQQNQPQLSQNLAGAAPWFGFTPHNQNASGQNDPDGSRRFNIFLARTMDPTTGTTGIVGAIAPPQAGNLFPHMMAMQARARLMQQQQQQKDVDDSPMRAELERWAQMLEQKMQTSGGNPLPPPQFFNATFTMENSDGQASALSPASLPPEVIQQTLESAMSELLDRLAKQNEDDVSAGSASDLSPELQKAFSQVLRNENFRKGIAENLARAAPALSDPKCQGVLLSVYVPPPPQFVTRSKTPSASTQNKQQQQQQNDKMGGWFQKILNNQEDNGQDSANKHKRVRTMAAAAAMMAAQNAQTKKAAKEAEGNNNVTKHENKIERNLARLESVCRPIIVPTPADPVRAKSWDAWINRERGSVIFRNNRKILNQQLEKHYLSLQEHTGTRGAGSALRSMLSIRPINGEMEDVIKCTIELEAAKSQRLHQSPTELHENEKSLEVDITLSQLLITEDCIVETEEILPAAMMAAAEKRRDEKSGVQFIHPSSLEAGLTMVCRISPSPAGGLPVSSSSSSSAITHRTREEIAALAQDKHERALVSQVVSPQDIGVTYDMIGGLNDVKELLRQSITYPLKFPHLYCEGIAREAVKGVLLFGPPGTGKTMLAKAVATEGGASFLSVDASSVENKWLGESEKNAKAVFTLARRLAPCVIFIDEVDSLLSSRDGTSDDSAHGTLTSVKTTMMSEWDGLNSGTNGAGEAGSDRVVVIGSTNRPFDLDEAVLRRFPRRILVDLPDLETRKEILEVTLAENRVDPSVNLTKIAERLEGYTGSDIKEVCREAVVQISHEQARLLDQGFLNTREDVTQGSLQRLRPATNEDFEKALSKLKRSVSEKGRELARVWEWNDEYGEIKKEKKNHLPHLANMYL